jgi:hypothetical protein
MGFALHARVPLFVSLEQLNQDTVRALRVQEKRPAFGRLDRRILDELRAARFHLGQRCVDVLDLQADMVHAFATLGQILGHA